MNGLSSSLDEVRAMTTVANTVSCGMVVIPPFTLIERVSALSKGSKLSVGGQDSHDQKSGAFTGDISSEMLVDAGARYVILGHSERRTEHRETNAVVSRKATTAMDHGLTVIVCVGETQEERDAGEALSVVENQLMGSVPDSATSANTVVAYEPVWAIGTGRVPSEIQIAEMHRAIHSKLVDRFGSEGGLVPILYGGSVKPSNARSIFAIEYVDGALVGGASLKAADFGAIAEALNT